MVSWRVLVPALIISLGGSFQYGYQMMVINASVAAFKKFVNQSYADHYGVNLDNIQWTLVWSLVVNMQTFGCLVGSFLIRYILEKFGRKRGFYFTSGLQIIACVMQSVSKPINTWELFTSGRFLAGIAQGVQFGLQGVYFTEISKKSERGMIGSITGLLAAFGTCSSIIAMPVILGDENRWPYLFVVGAVITTFSCIILPFIPESPKYLANKGEFGPAGQALRWFGRNENEIKEELNEIRQELSKMANTSEVISLKSLFQTPYIRNGIFLVWMVMLSTAYSGFTGVSYFSTSILESTGVSKQYAIYGTGAFSLVALLGACLGTLSMDKFGRRTVMLICIGLLLVLNATFILLAYLTRVHSVQWASYANIAVIASFPAVYGFGPGHVQWFLASELVPQKARSAVNGITLVVRWILVGTAGLVLFPLQGAIYEFSFFLHIVPLLVAIAYFAIALPETKNRSTLEIMKDLGYRDDEVLNDDFIKHT